MPSLAHRHPARVLVLAWRWRVSGWHWMGLDLENASSSWPAWPAPQRHQKLICGAISSAYLCLQQVRAVRIAGMSCFLGLSSDSGQGRLGCWTRGRSKPAGQGQGYGTTAGAGQRRWATGDADSIEGGAAGVMHPVFSKNQKTAATGLESTTMACSQSTQGFRNDPRSQRLRRSKVQATG